MQTRHVAYGLDLSCSFALPGMPAAGSGARAAAPAEQLPRLRLERRSAAALASDWSGAGAEPAWRGVLGDGCSLTVERGTKGEVMFTYGERARFLLHPSLARLDCAPLREGLHWQQVLLGRVLPNVALMRGYEALHASAVNSPRGVVAVAAPSGTGKTTLALELMRRGWPLFADDVVTIGEGTEGVRAHPGTPHMNVAASPVRSGVPDRGVGAGSARTDGQPQSASRGTPWARSPRSLHWSTLGVLAGERWVAIHEHTGEPRPVCMICLLERGSGRSLGIQTLAASPLPLAPYMLGLDGLDPGHAGERERTRFVRYADLVGNATLVRLTCGSDTRPGELADMVERAVSAEPAPAAGGVGR